MDTHQASQEIQRMHETDFFNWKIGVALIVAGPVMTYAAYKISGGATNPNLMKPDSSLYEREGRRVLEWATEESTTQDT